MRNFYSRWTDKEMEEVVIPILHYLGLPTLHLDDYRGFDNIDSEAPFIHMSLPKQELTNRINHAISLYYREKNPVSIEDIVANWSNLDVLDYESKISLVKKSIKDSSFNWYDNCPVFPALVDVKIAVADKYYNMADGSGLSL